MTQQTTSTAITAPKSKTANVKNKKTQAARDELIKMSKEAQEILKILGDGFCGDETELFEDCETVNDVLLALHQMNSSCRVFKTFHDWKKLGYL